MKRLFTFLFVVCIALSIRAQSLYENFDGTSLTAGWSIIDSGTNSASWGLDTYKPYKGTGHAALDTYIDGGGAADDWLITPQITVKKNYQIVLYAKSDHNTYKDGFKLKVSKTGKNVADFTIELLAVEEVPNDYTKYVVKLNDVAALAEGDQVYVALHCNSNGSWFYIDEFAYERAGDEFYVDFESGIPQDWKIIDSGTNTGSWQIYDENSHDGTGCIFLDTYDADDKYTDDWFITQKFYVGEKNELSFWGACNADYPDEITVYASKTGTLSVDFTITVMPTFELTDNYKKYSIILTDVSGISATDEIYLAVNSKTNGSRIYIDQFRVGEVLAPQMDYAFAMSNTELMVYYDIELGEVDASKFVLKSGSSNITFSTATIDTNDAKLVELSGASASFTADNVVDELTDGGQKTVTFYAGILPLSFINETNPNGKIAADAEYATFKGVVTHINKTADRVWLQDGSGAYHAANTYDMVANNLSVGDEILIYGARSPYRNQTEISPAFFIKKISSNNTPVATTITAGDIKYDIPADTDPAEKYEGQLVKIANAKVTEWDGAYFKCTTDNGTTTFYVGNALKIYNQADKEFNEQTLTLNSTYTFTGIITGRDAVYVLNPRKDADFAVVSAIEEPVRNGSFTVYPNPVSDFANINLNLQKTAKVQFTIFDMSGKLIKTVDYQSIEAGIHELQISFEHLRAGNYMLQMNNNGETLTTKISVR